MLTLLASILFSFNYSFMMEQRGYFPSDSGNYWSVVRKFNYANSYEISECVIDNDSLICWKYIADCDNGTLVRHFPDNKIYINGKQYDYTSTFNDLFLSFNHQIISDGIFEVIEIYGPSWNIKCGDNKFDFVKNSYRLGECEYSPKVIETESYEAALCKDGI